MPLRIRKEVQDKLKASLDGAPEAVSAPAAPPPVPEAAAIPAEANSEQTLQKPAARKKKAAKPRAKRPPKAKSAGPKRRRASAAGQPARRSRPKSVAPPAQGKAVGFRDFSGEIETIRMLFEMMILHAPEPARLEALKSLTERYLADGPTQEKLDQVRMLLQRHAVILRHDRAQAPEPGPQADHPPAAKRPVVEAVAIAAPVAEAPAPDRVRRGEAAAPEAKAADAPSTVPPLAPSPPRRSILAWLRRSGASGGGGKDGGGNADPAAQGRPFRAKLKTVLMASVWVGVGGATLAYAGALLYVNTMRLEIDTALISGNIEPVNAPFDGSVTSLLVKAGDRLGEGQRFMVLEDPEVEKQVKLAAVKVDRAREDLRLKEAELESEKLKRDEYITISRNKLEKIDSDIEALEKLERVARERFNRLSDLFKKGIVIRPRVEEASDKLAEVTTQLQKARINKRERDMQMENVASGHYFDGNQLVGKLREAEAAVVRATAEIDLALEELQALQQRRQVNRVVASHDSRILKVLRHEGAAVKRGDTMLVVERLDERIVHAFLRQEEISRIAIGDEAVVYIPALRAKATARVTQVDRNAAFLDDVDARYSWKIARDGGPKATDKDRTARVTLKFEGQDKAIVDTKFELGMPTVVSFPRRSVNTVFSSFTDIGARL